MLKEINIFLKKKKKKKTKSIINMIQELNIILMIQLSVPTVRFKQLRIILFLFCLLNAV